MNEKKGKINPLDDLKKKLKTFGLKATPQRLAVHEAMCHLGHASADMVSDYIKEHKPSVKITVASIYNVLSQLSLYNIYQYRLSSNSKMYFDVNHTKHIHLYDTENNTYSDVMDSKLLELIEENIDKRKFKGYQVYGVDINILCRPRKKKSIGKTA